MRRRVRTPDLTMRILACTLLLMSPFEPSTQDTSDLAIEILNASRPSRWVRITPELAERWLTHNDHNRNIKPSILAQTKKALLDGKFEANGETIVISPDGELLDGQHRLTAVKETGISITSLVVWGVPRSCFHTIDTGGIRAPADVLSILKERFPQVAASAARCVNGLFSGHGSKIPKSACDAPADVLKRHPGLRDSIVYANRYKPGKPFRSKALCAALHYVLGRLNKELRDEFFEKLTTGLGMTGDDDPVYLLRERLMAGGASHGERLFRDSPNVVACLTFSAWELVEKGKRRKTLSKSHNPLESVRDFMRRRFPEETA